MTKAKKRVEFQIDPGTENGERIALKGEGDEAVSLLSTFALHPAIIHGGCTEADTCSRTYLPETSSSTSTIGPTPLSSPTPLLADYQQQSKSVYQRLCSVSPESVLYILTDEAYA